MPSPRPLQLDEGHSVLNFEGGEEKPGRGRRGRSSAVYLDLTELKPDFQGEIEIGVRGKIRRVNLPHMIAQ